MGTEKQILAHEGLGSDFQDSPSSDVLPNIHSLDGNSPEQLPLGRFGVFLCSCLKGMFILVAPIASALTMLPHSPFLKNSADSHDRLGFLPLQGLKPLLEFP